MRLPRRRRSVGAEAVPLTHHAAENFRKGGVHGVGTVVFTVSAQFGVPVVPYIWSLTRGITSYAREIVASLAEVERRGRLPRAARATGPIAAVESKGLTVRFGSEADVGTPVEFVR